MDMSTLTDISAVLRAYDEERSRPNFNPTAILTRLCEIIEEETLNYWKMDPDPFDERHPGRADPECSLGVVLKTLFKKDVLINHLVNDYLRDNFFRRNGIDGDNVQLNIAACRLMLDILPGLDAEVAFNVNEYDSMILRLHKWALNSIEPLQTYATGLLGAAMHMSELATTFKEQNNQLIPIMLQRLWRLKQYDSSGMKCNQDLNYENTVEVRPFKHFGSSDLNDSEKINVDKIDYGNKRKSPYIESSNIKRPKVYKNLDDENSHSVISKSINIYNETSNSSWADMEAYVIGSVQVFPPTIVTRQIFIIKYLTPLGEYQEFLSHIIEHNALELTVSFINLRENKETRLAFEACKYLAALLCHKKFAIEFVTADGLQRLLDLPRPSVAATGASICLFYLGHCKEAMENICQLPSNIISDLVRFCLWLLECSHDSGRCHAVMFFALTFQFKMILNEFDNFDGLRKLFNTISTLPILSLEDDDESRNLSDENNCAAKQIIRHVCFALWRYFEAHLFLQAEAIERLNDKCDDRVVNLTCSSSSKILIKMPNEETQSKIELLFNLMPFRATWAPVENFFKLGGIALLLKVIAFSAEWNYSGRVETLKNALDVLSICSVSPKVQSNFCDKLNPNNVTSATGINIFLSAAENEIACDVDVQKAALNVLIHCVCAPVHRPAGNLSTSSGKNVSVLLTPHKKLKHKIFRSSEELIKMMWDNVRANSGIMVFISLLNTKVPITDADHIRTMACRALVGLARSEPARQIIGKLPLITSGELQMLMKDPILQENRKEHVSFQKYALNLLEILAGRTKHKGIYNDISSLLNIHKANVVAQTRIQFNETQLLQLIHQHLSMKGFQESAEILKKEAKLTSTLPQLSSTFSTPQTPFKVTSANSVNLLRSYYSPSSKSLTANCSTSKTPTRLDVLNITTPTSSKLSLSNHLLTESKSPCEQLYAMPSSSSSSSLNNSISSAVVSGNKCEVKIIRRNPITPSSILMKNNRLKQQQVQHWQNSNESIFIRQATQPIFTSNVNVPEVNLNPSMEQSRISLDSIIVEYLMNQHALCKNPMATCPQFNLIEPHKCPDPKPKITSSPNIVLRQTRRPLGYQSKNMDRRFLHSKFCPVGVIRMTNDLESTYTQVAFLPNNRQILIGDFSGKIRIYNILTESEEFSSNCFESYVVNIQPNRTGDLILASQTWGEQLSALFDINLSMKYGLNDHDYAEFGKRNNWAIGTKSEIATIFDLATGVALMTLNPKSSNQYTKNKATFDLSDSLVLSDGVLWDVNSSKGIHKFDKLNQTQSGVFHPNGLEIVSNSEVWDLRTFHLLKTVPALNNAQAIFAPVNQVIYTMPLEEDPEDENSRCTTFQTLDATDYYNISLIDVKKIIYDLAVNSFDTQIAIVENQGLNKEESIVRLYDVGRLRNEDDDEQQDDDEDGTERSNSIGDHEDLSSADSDHFYGDEWIDIGSDFDEDVDDEADEEEDYDEDDEDDNDESDEDEDEDYEGENESEIDQSE